jgi:hypothetical protein
MANLTEKQVILFDIILSSLIKAAINKISGMTDEEVDQVIDSEEIRKDKIMDIINSH